MQTDATPFQQGQTLDKGRYVLRSLLDAKGTLAVWLASDEWMDTQVVVKCLVPSLENQQSRKQQFLDEYRKLAQLGHQHARIIKILHVGEEQGMPYVVMHHMSGGSLEQWSQRLQQANSPQLNWGRALRWVQEIADALDFVHANGIYHCDVRPRNILFDETGHAVLTNFLGNWRVDGRPQQHAEGDGRGDQLALAATLYESLSGRPPYTRAVNASHGPPTHTPPPPIHQLCEFLPPTLSPILTRALHVDPAQRYETCEDFADALLDSLHISTVEQVPVVAEASESADVEEEIAATPTETFGKETTESFATPAEEPTAKPAKPAANPMVWMIGGLILLTAIAVGWVVQFMFSGEVVSPPPIAVEDQIDVGSDESEATGDLLENDSDPDDRPLRVVRVDSRSVVGSVDFTPAKGVDVTVYSDGKYSVRVSRREPTIQALKPGESLDIAFSYKITNDSAADQPQQSVRLQVWGANDLPIANPDELTIDGKSSPEISFDPLANDTDPEQGTLKLVSIAGKAIDEDTIVETPLLQGRIRLMSDGKLQYVPQLSSIAKLNGKTYKDEFEYEIIDPHDGKATGKITVTGTNLIVPKVDRPSPKPATTKTVYLVEIGKYVFPFTAKDLLKNYTTSERSSMTLVSLNGRKIETGTQIHLPSGGSIRIVSATSFIYSAPISSAISTFRDEFELIVSNATGETHPEKIRVLIPPKSQSDPTTKADTAASFLNQMTAASYPHPTDMAKPFHVLLAPSSRHVGESKARVLARRDPTKVTGIELRITSLIERTDKRRIAFRGAGSEELPRWELQIVNDDDSKDVTKLGFFEVKDDVFHFYWETDSSTTIAKIYADTRRLLATHVLHVKATSGTTELSRSFQFFDPVGIPQRMVSLDEMTKTTIPIAETDYSDGPLFETFTSGPSIRMHPGDTIQPETARLSYSVRGLSLPVMRLARKDPFKLICKYHEFDSKTLKEKTEKDTDFSMKLLDDRLTMLTDPENDERADKTMRDRYRNLQRYSKSITYSTSFHLYYSTTKGAVLLAYPRPPVSSTP